ncbi:unnamed protein product [Toxocara canis]|uniref:VWFA domain-containing protein n=1 Tax=Toxocara canis TaxID=6265 RepID=A0A183V274_TOXCA|nr:unnamed protein product [Toxocara canis]
MVLFSDFARVSFGLNAYASNAGVTGAIRNSTYGGGITNIAAGMHVAITEVFTGEPRSDVPRVMIIVTDGMDTTDVQAEHTLASGKNITTYVLGIGKETNYEELVRAAGDPKRVYNLTSYNELADAMDRVCRDIPGANAPRRCECNYRNTWLDLVFIFDSSKAVNLQDFLAVKNFVASFVKQIQVSQQTGKFSRVAFINMGDQAEVIGNLTTFKSSAEAATALLGMQYLNSNNTNLRDAMVKAQNIFADDERPNVQNVVVVFTSKNEPCNYQQNEYMKLSVPLDQNPCRIAAHLRETNNIVLTVGMKFDGTQRYPNLKVASNCYSLNFDINMTNSFLDAMCRGILLYYYSYTTVLIFCLHSSLNSAHRMA